MTEMASLPIARARRLPVFHNPIVHIPLSSMVTRSALLAAVIVAAVAPPSRAQGVNPPTIPTVLASAIMNGFASVLGESPRFVVDRVPEGWPQAIMPPGSLRTVGGVTLASIRVAVFSMPRSADGTGGYRALLTRAGFKPFTTPNAPGGFVGPIAEHTTFCDDSSMVSIVTVDSTVSTRWIAVTYASGEMSRGCDSSAAAYGLAAASLDLPPLRAPRGMTVRTTSSGASGTHVEATAKLDTSLTADAVIAHYAAELATAGWTVSAKPLVGDGVAMQRISARDKKGADWRGVLLLITAGDTQELTLRMTRAGEK